MAKALVKLMALFQGIGTQLDIAGRVWDGHGKKEVECIVSNVKVVVNVNTVRDALSTNMKALWGDQTCVVA